MGVRGGCGGCTTVTVGGTIWPPGFVPGFGGFVEGFCGGTTFGPVGGGVVWMAIG
jgi:hypothetical protein